MAHSIYDAKWRDAMAELKEQLYLEDHTLSGGKDPTAPPSLTEANQHWASLYVKYLEIFRTLEGCFDGIVQPQKRVDIKLVLELVMSRIVELKALLIKWNPAHPSLVAEGCDGPLAWPYVNLDDMLVDLKLPPKVLEVPIPRYFVEEAADKQAARDKLIQAVKTMKLGEDADIGLELDREEKVAPPLVDFTLAEAIELIQRMERGRQGIVHAKLTERLSAEEGANTKTPAFKSATQTAMGASAALEMEPETAAGHIQRLYRGLRSRRAANLEREQELAFIGMSRPKLWDDAESKREEAKRYEELDQARARRKLEQKENEDGYSQALIDLHGTVLEEEGPDMRERMMDERRAWFTDELGKGVFPEDLGDFYLAQNPEGDEDPEAAAAAAAAEAEAAKKGKGGKDDKKKGKGEEEEEAEKIPPLTGPTQFTATLQDCLDRFSGVWLDRDESNNFQQKHDVDLAKNVVRPNVEEEVRENVDKMLVVQLQNLKAQLEAASGAKKGKKKKDKGKKGKKGKKDKKGKKGKPLPGEKLCAGMEFEEMLGTLIEHGVVCEASPGRLADLIGEFNYLGSTYQSQSEAKDAWGNWVPQDPSLSQIRSLLTEQIVLPLGSPFLRVTAPYAKSALLYGPAGSGKTTAVQAVANHTNAVLINLSASVLDNLPKEFREGKSGPTRLVHMAFAVARHPEFAPGVIYIDQVDRIFVGKKKGGAGDAAKFKKDLVTYANSLKPEERVVVLGCTSEPFNIPDTEHKDLRTVFQMQLHLPYPDYASRVMLWRAFLEEAFDKLEMDIPDTIDLFALSLVSEGYSAGNIRTAISRTLTQRRCETLKTRPVTEQDFVGPLSMLPLTYQEDNVKFQAFTASISGLQQRRDAVKAILAGDGTGDGKKDAKKKKK
ncbi:26S proteasome regulatory subunit 6B-like [Hondaea fermentalgiana]|uniref:26S proteasome regulatory subunit 6B-like n=1 Tax=Hondaea fermentalgiana TaxID=2315210 RepID=A0A2R5G1L2_9STRA|nr:26S proteasome regulatory subunit 6B-like [Hondaea fermentalgiana]|eukprot:GBG24916.1 26S proteasome regulatory subunit 6B-like [Hondaea fermentalgiana]